jgi:hypothetical protein
LIFLETRRYILQNSSTIGDRELEILKPYLNEFGILPTGETITELEMILILK